MKQKTFSEMKDVDIWADLVDAEVKARIVKETPLYKALRQPATGEPWCCARIRRTSHHIQFQDGTRMRVHFCPRCGRRL